MAISISSRASSCSSFASSDIFGMAQPILRCVEFTTVQRHDSEIIEGTAVTIIEPKSCEVKGGGGSGISFRQTQIPQREICLRISGNVSASKLQFFFGEGEIN